AVGKEDVFGERLELHVLHGRAGVRRRNRRSPACGLRGTRQPPEVGRRFPCSLAVRHWRRTATRRMTMRPIMLATDGTPAAEAATDEAISLAKSLGLPLAVVCVEHDQTPMYGYYGYAEVVADLHKIQQENIE